jgi:hypothetical protein
MAIPKDENTRRMAINELYRRGEISVEQYNKLGGSKVLAEPVPVEEQFQYEMEDWARKKIEAGELELIKPTFAQRMWAEAPQMIGGTVGGMTGGKIVEGALAGAKTAAGQPFAKAHPYLTGAAIVGGAGVGAALGGMGGKGYQQAYRMTRPGAKAQPLSEIYTEQLIAGLEEGASELAGRGIAAGVAKAGEKLVAPLIRPGAKEAAMLLQASGVPITIAQATDNRLIDIMEAVAEGSLFGGGKLQKLKLIEQPKAIAKAVASMSDDFAEVAGRQMTSEEVGEIVLDAINKENKAFNRASRSIYKQVDKLIQRSGMAGEVVDIIPLKKFAIQRAKSIANINRSAMGDTLLDNILKLPDRMTFKQASSLRTALMTQTRSMSATKDVALGLAKQLTKMTDDSMERSGKLLSNEAFDMWRFANKFHRQGKEIFNSKIVKSLSKRLADNPEKVVPMIFQKGASKQIRLLKNTVDEPTWNALKHGYIESLFAKAAPGGGEFSGKKFLTMLDDNILNATFDKTEINSIRELGHAIELLQKPTQEFAATGKLVVAIAQAGAITTSAYTKRPGQAAVILLTPYALGRIAMNKKWSRLLIEGTKAPVKRSVALTRIARISAGLDKEYRKQQREKRQQEIADLTLAGGFGGP